MPRRRIFSSTFQMKPREKLVPSLSPSRAGGDEWDVQRNAMNDWDRLQAWACHRSDAAFRQLVEQYVGLVYAAAMRQVRTSALAEDVTQAVFVLLARKAGTLGRGVILASWLFRTTRFVAARAARGEQRRQRRESEVVAMNTTLGLKTPESEEETWKEIEPHLDAAVAALSGTDRDAVLLRFYQRKTLREVGEVLGISEEAAKKRIARALEKLRGFLASRGAVATTSLLALLLAAPRADAVPSALASSIHTVAAGSNAASASVETLVAGGARDWLWAHLTRWAAWSMPPAVLLAGVAVWLSSSDPAALRPGGGGTAAPNHLAGARSASETTFAAANPEKLAASTEVGSGAVELTALSAEDGQPIPGTLVYASIYGGPSEVSAVSRSTSADGRCVIPVPSDTFQVLRVWVSAPGRVPRVMDWRKHEFGGLPLRHVCRMERGASLVGEVRDEGGSTVAATRLQVIVARSGRPEREDIGFHASLNPIVADQAGRFAIDQMPFDTRDQSCWLAAVHPDFAPTVVRVADRFPTSELLTLVLRPGLVLSGRVRTPDGSPVTDSEVTWSTQQPGVGGTARSDREGRFEFPHVPAEPVTLRARLGGYRSVQRTVAAADGMAEVVLEPSVAEPTEEVPAATRSRVAGSVVDDQTGAPIQGFRVIEQPGMEPPRLLGEGREGAFAWNVSWDEPIANLRLTIEADGFWPEARTVSLTAGAPTEVGFRLKSRNRLASWVYQPDGRPAAGADVSVAGDGFGLIMIEPGKPVNAGSPVRRSTTDGQGGFSLAPQDGMRHVVIVHESGILILPTERVTNGAVRLEEWGSIRGILRAGSQPLSSAEVNVGVLADGAGPDDPRMAFSYNVRTDSEGRFAFQKVPPGSYSVHRIAGLAGGRTGTVGMSHATPVVVRPGETSEVIVGGNGRYVVGRLVLSDALPGYDWSSDLHALVLDRPDLQPPAYRPDVEALTPRERRLQSFALAAYEHARRKYYLAVKPDGSFRIDDVPAGDYTLLVNITAPPADPLAEEWEPARPSLGRLQLGVVVRENSGPDQGEVVDLGVVTIPIRKLP